MIKRLVIHRFRGIRQGTLEDLGKINVLIGPNNSGKTAVLEMLYLAGVAGRECEVLIPDVEPSAWPAATLNRLDLLGCEPLPRLRTRHGEAREWKEAPAVHTDEYTLDVELVDLPNEYPLRRFTLSASPEPGGRKAFFVKKDVSCISLFRLSPHTNVSVPEPMMPSFFNAQQVSLENTYWTYLWEKPWVYRWDKKEYIDHFAVWALEGEMPVSENVLFFDFHTANQHFRKTFTQDAKNSIPDWYDKIAASIAKIFSDLQGAEIEIDDAPGKRNEETGYIRFRGKARIGIDHLGDGARHALKVLASLIALREQVSKERPGLFLWEDPELFMHPSTLNKLFREVLSLVRDKPIQIFLSSQSIEAIAMVTAQIEDLKLQSDYRVFRLDLEHGQLYAAKYRYENVSAWLESGMDLRFWNVEVLPISYSYKRLVETSPED